MKPLLLLSLTLLLGCLPTNKPAVVSSGNNNDGSGKNYHTPPSYEPPIVDSLLSTYSSRNFDQMIKIFSKATGVHISRAEIRNEIKKVRPQLPLSYDPGSYSTFNHVALTSLAVQFCKSFIDGESDVSETVILGVAQSDAAWSDKLALAMINRLAITDYSEDPFLPIAKNSMVGLMKEDGGIITNNFTYKKRAAMGCTMFLASSYFSFD